MSPTRRTRTGRLIRLLLGVGVILGLISGSVVATDAPAQAESRLVGQLIYNQNANYWPIKVGSTGPAGLHLRIATDYWASSVEGVLALEPNAKWSIPGPGETGKVIKVGGPFDGYCMSTGLQDIWGGPDIVGVSFVDPATCSGNAEVLMWEHRVKSPGNSFTLRPKGNTSRLVQFPFTYNPAEGLDGTGVIMKEGTGSFSYGGFEPAPVTPDYAGSTLSVSDGQVYWDGGSHTVTARVKGSDGSWMSNQDVTFTMYTANGSAITSESTVAPVTKTTDGQGYAVATITASKAGFYSVRAKIGSSPVANNVNRVVEFVNKPAQKETSYLEVSTGTRWADQADKHTLTAHIFDANGNHKSGVPVTYKLFSDAAGKYPVAASTAVPDPVSPTSTGGGLAVSTVSSRLAGTYYVQAIANIDGVATPIRNSLALKIQFVNGDGIDFSQSKLTVTPGEKVVGVEDHTATATIYKSVGVVSQGKAVIFKIYNQDGVTPATGASITESALTGSDGKAHATIRGTAAGTYKVVATYADGGVIAGSPQTVVFVDPKPDMSRTLLEVTKGNRWANGIDEHDAVVTVRDTTGAVMSGQPVKLVVRNADGTAALNAAVSPNSATTGGSGKVSATVTATTPGNYTVVATVASERVTGGENHIATFIPAGPEVDYGSSNVVVTPGEKIANGVETHTATATVMSTTNAPMDGVSVNFKLFNEDWSAASQATLSTSTRSTGSDGKAAVSITATKPGKYWVEATVAGKGIKNSREVFALFVPEPVVPGLNNSELYVSQDNRFADGVATHVATATIRSTTATGGVPIKDQQVVFTLTNPVTGVTLTSTGTNVTDSNGVATARITSTKAGDYVVEARLAGDTSSIQAPVNRTARFIAKPAASLSADHTVSASSVPVGGTFEYRIFMRNTGNADEQGSGLKFLTSTGSTNQLTTDFEIVDVNVTSGWFANSGTWYKDVSANSEVELVLTLKAKKAGTYTSKITQVRSETVYCSANGQAACGPNQKITVFEPTPPIMECPTGPSLDGKATLTGKVTAGAEKVRVYQHPAGGGAAKLLGEATIAGTGDARTWSYKITDPLEQGKHTFTVRGVDASGTETADSAPKCDLAVVYPVDVVGEKRIAPVAQQSGLLAQADPANWEITVTEGGNIRPISGGAREQLEPGKTYTVGERMRITPVPAVSSLLYAQRGQVECVDGAGAPLPASIFTPATGTLKLDASGSATPVRAPITCGVTNQTANVSFVTKRAGGQTMAPALQWGLELANANSTYNVRLDSVHFVSEARPSGYDLTASAPIGYTVTGIDRLRTEAPDCAAAANAATGATEMCWERVSSGPTLAAAEVAQGKHSVYRIVAEYAPQAPPLPLTGGLGSWQFTAGGIGLLLLASVAYWRRSRRFAVAGAR